MILEIGPYRYTVEFEQIRNDAAGTWGQFDHVSQTLHVNSNATPDRQRVALMHEALHCIFDLYGAPDTDRDTEEQLLAIIAPAFVDLLRRNPEFVSTLMESEA